MLIVCFLDAVANHCLFFKQVTGPKVPLEGGMYNVIGRVGGVGGGLWREKERDIILEQQPNVIVAFVSGER